MLDEPDATMQPAPQDIQLMSKHRVLSLKPQLRLEWRGQDGQSEAEQPDRSASLGDSITSSTRIRFSVHTTSSSQTARRRSSGHCRPFVVPTSGFKLLYGFVIVRIDRRDLVWINVTTNPTAEWIARKITEAFLGTALPGYMIRDRKLDIICANSSQAKGRVERANGTLQDRLAIIGWLRRMPAHRQPKATGRNTKLFSGGLP
jgi:hypothetical protein